MHLGLELCTRMDVHPRYSFVLVLVELVSDQSSHIGIKQSHHWFSLFCIHNGHATFETLKKTFHARTHTPQLLKQVHLASLFSHPMPLSHRRLVLPQLKPALLRNVL
jgi:hypothetical protein